MAKGGGEIWWNGAGMEVWGADVKQEGGERGSQSYNGTIQNRTENKLIGTTTQINSFKSILCKHVVEVR